MQEADAILFVVDAISGVTPADAEVAEMLRRNQKKVEGSLYPPVFLVVNKSDSAALRRDAAEFYELGMGEPYPISAVHGTGTGDLLDDLVAAFPKQPEEEEDESVKIAMVGKPNVGKSSLLNRSPGRSAPSSAPSPAPPAMRSIPTLSLEDIPVTLIDTAGIRRRGKIDPGVEKYSVLRSMRAIERADVALLMIDAGGWHHRPGHAHRRLHPGSLEEHGGGGEQVGRHRKRQLHDGGVHQPHPPGIELHGLRADHVHLCQNRPARGPGAAAGAAGAGGTPGAPDHRRCSTASCRMPRSAMPPTSRPGRPSRSITAPRCAPTRPPFCSMCNNPKLAHFSYLRFLENQLRKEYPFTGTPIRLVFKARSRD